MKLFVIFCLWFTALSFTPASRGMSFYAIACYAIGTTAATCLVTGVLIRQRRGGRF